MSYFVGAKCKDGDHIGEGDPKGKDDDIDTTNGKLSLSIGKNQGSFWARVYSQKPIIFMKGDQTDRTETQNRGSML